MLSYMYYEVRDLIKKEYKEEFSLGVKQRILFATCLLGVLIIIATPMASIIHKYLWFIGIPLGGLLTVISIVIASKFQKKYNNKKHIKKIEKGIKELGLNNAEKISKLRKEIEDINIKEEERAQRMIQMVGQVFKGVFWVPIAFLIGAFFNSNSIAIDFDSILTLSVVLLLIAITLIGVLISLFPSVPYLFQYGRRERDRVLQYLLDIEYLLQEEKEILLSGK